MDPGVYIATLKAANVCLECNHASKEAIVIDHGSL